VNDPSDGELGRKAVVDVIVEQCAALDVHDDTVMACVRTAASRDPAQHHANRAERRAAARKHRH
jgi:hypothetical protein